MYTVIERRKMNAARGQETMRRAQAEFFPKLRQAPGFVGFYLVADEANGTNTAVIVWEDRASAAAFEAQAAPWLRALDELGHAVQSTDQGETVVQVTREP